MYIVHYLSSSPPPLRRKCEFNKIENKHKFPSDRLSQSAQAHHPRTEPILIANRIQKGKQNNWKRAQAEFIYRIRRKYKKKHREKTKIFGLNEIESEK